VKSAGVSVLAPTIALLTMLLVATSRAWGSPVRWATYVFAMLPPPPGYTVGYRLQILLQPPVLMAAFLISVITSTLSSILPAFKASRLKIVDALGHI